MEIRLARGAEYEAVLELLRRSKLPEAGLGAHRETLLVAVDDGRVVGSAALEHHGEGVLLRSVAVDQALRGQGLGVALVRAALDLARVRSARAVYLLTETAAPFFKRLAFRDIPRSDAEPVVGRSEEFTSACPAGATCMILELLDSTVREQGAA